MTNQEDYNPSEKVVEQLAKNGWGAIPELIRIMVNQAMQEERAHYLQAGKYERTEERKGYANGYKPKTVKTRVGEITFSIPQVREGGFYPSVLEKGLRSERALTMTLAEMYVQGVSTPRSKRSPSSCAGSRCLVNRSAELRPNSTVCSRNGASDHWEKSGISTWMPATRRCARAARCGMQPS